MLLPIPPALAREVRLGRVRRRVEAVLETAARRPGCGLSARRTLGTHRALGAIAGHHDAGVVHPLLHQREQQRGVLRMQADAAMRGRPAEMRDLVAAMDGVAAIEEDRICLLYT